MVANPQPHLRLKQSGENIPEQMVQDQSLLFAVESIFALGDRDACGR